MLVEVLFTKWNTVTLAADEVAAGATFITAGSVSSWTNFSVPITYASGSFPDTALIFLSAGSGQSPVVGDFLHIDGLAFTGSVPAGIDEYKDLIGLSIYPNPFSSQTTINFDKEQTNTFITITDILGKQIRTQTFSGKQYIIDKGDLSKGIYFVQVTDENKNSINKKIVIQ